MEQIYAGQTELSILKKKSVSEKSSFLKQMHKLTNLIADDAAEADIRSVKTDFERIYDQYAATLAALYGVYADKNDEAGQDRLTAEIAACQKDYAVVNEKFTDLLVEIKSTSSRNSRNEHVRTPSIISARTPRSN